MKSCQESIEKCDRCQTPLAKTEIKTRTGRAKTIYRLWKTSSDEKICEKCIKCESCGEPKLHRYRGNEIHSSFLRKGRYKRCRMWFCNKYNCQEALNSNPGHAQHQQNEKERKLKAENFEYETSGLKSPIRVNPFIGVLMHPGLYDLPPGTNIVSNRTTLMMVLGLFYRTVYDRTTMEVTESMMNYIAPSIEDGRLEEFRRLRDGDGTYEYIRVLGIVTLMQNRVKRSIDQEDMEKCLYMNCSLYHIARCVNNRKPIDGLQDVILRLMRHWWDLGFYPRARRDYLDISNKWLLNILNQRLMVIPLAVQNNNNDPNAAADIELSFNPHEIECVVCMGEFEKLVMTDCRHRLTCQDCSSKLTKCPVCMQVIARRILVSRIPNPDEAVEI